MATLIITEKTSQAQDLRAALGDRFGQILPVEGRFLRLAEPHEIKCLVSLACVLLKPDGLPRKAGIRLLAADALRRTKSYKSLDGFLLRCHKSIMANALGGGETP